MGTSIRRSRTAALVVLTAALSGGLPQLMSSSAAATPACGDETFSVAQVQSSQTGWNAMGQRYYGIAELIVTTGSPGEVVLSEPSGKYGDTSYTAVSPGSNYWVEAIDTAPSPAGSTDQYTVNFYPGDNGQPATWSGQCQQSDGSLATLGPNGTYHAPPLTATITWLPKAEGASVSVNGVTVPGSATYAPVSLAAPTMAVTGDVRVGDDVTCAVTPTPTTKVSAWNWQWMAGTKSLGYTFPYRHPPYSDPFQIPVSAYGQPLRCGGLDNGLDGGPNRIFSPPVTVGPGLLKATQRPLLLGVSSVGQTLSVGPVGWNTEAARATAYQWYVGTTKIAGATLSHYRIPKQDKGKRLRCLVTGRAYAYTTASVMSFWSYPING